MHRVLVLGGGFGGIATAVALRSHLEPADVLVDAMRGRFHTWTRIRINLQHVPDALRPAQEPIESDPTIAGWPADAKPPRRRQRT